MAKTSSNALQDNNAFGTQVATQRVKEKPRNIKIPQKNDRT